MIAHPVGLCHCDSSKSAIRMSFDSTKQSFNNLGDNLKGSLILILAAGLFSLMVVIIKLLGTHLHVTQILLVRQLIMTAIVAPVVLRGFPGVLKTKQPGLQLLRILLALGAMLMGFSAYSQSNRSHFMFFNLSVEQRIEIKAANKKNSINLIFHKLIGHSCFSVWHQH